uniref:Uncharacterized protein n=1 Tax=Globisporangium ultimum (strain ATCC 200006 / CBS 805.95 / DAOM BR144) TaxID=431595 RepID=K3WZN7_GLOUD
MGLSALELSAETLYPGDTIEYFSMAFVNGDPRGHRVAKVLKVLKDEPEYPLRLESQELLPVTLMIRRKLDRHDDEVDAADAKWRKIRTFKLVTGEVKGATRADRLNAGLKHSIASAIQAAKTQFASKKSHRDPKQTEEDDDLNESKALETKHKSPKRKKEQKKKHKALESSGGSNSSRFQQQQLSFSKQETAASTKGDNGDADKKKPSTSLTKTSREREEFSCKRASLDTLSRKTEHGSGSREKRHRHEASSPGTLKHKKPRLLSPARGTHHHSPLKARPHHHSHGTPEKRRKHESSSPSNRSSKYFAEGLKEQHKTRSHPKSSLLHFMDRIEEKKSSRETTLDEYLALEREQKEFFEGTTELKKKAEDTTSRSTTSTNKWSQEREKFRNKHQTETKGSYASMGKWLKSARKEMASSSSLPGQHSKLSLEKQSHGKKSLKQQQHSQYSRPRSFGLQRPQLKASLEKDARLDFSMTAKDNRSPPLPRDNGHHHEDRKRESKYVKRKSSSDFTSHSPKVPQHGKLNLMNTWISKQRR